MLQAIKTHINAHQLSINFQNINKQLHQLRPQIVAADVNFSQGSALCNILAQTGKTYITEVRSD